MRNQSGAFRKAFFKNKKKKGAEKWKGALTEDVFKKDFCNEDDNNKFCGCCSLGRLNRQQLLEVIVNSPAC